MSTVLSASRQVWEDAAIRIGNRVVERAVHDSDSCTWNAWTSKGIPGVRDGQWSIAGPTLYQGTAGSALFLTELFRVTGQASFLNCARSAMRTAYRRGLALPPSSHGFHSGRVGIAFALVRLAMSSGDNSLLRQAENLLEPIATSRMPEVPGDVIGGAAGAVPALLHMASSLSAELTTDVAVRMADHIFQTAKRRPIGWSWGGVESAVDDLLGYSHGASGYAHALAETFAVTGDVRYAYAARQAFEYEDSRFDPTLENWPDLRHFELSEYSLAGGWDLLSRKLRTGFRLPPYRPTSVIMWCHGAPGIGLARARCFEILKDDRLAMDAKLACRTSRAAIRSGGSGYSLCHGHMGNCETLLTISRLFDEPGLLSAVEDRVRVGIELFEAKAQPWPCGTLGGVADSSLMVGEAGIGYFLLRLLDVDTPNVLCLRGAGDTKQVREGALGGAARETREHISAFFGNTLARLASAHVQCDALIAGVVGVPAPVIETANRLRATFSQFQSSCCAHEAEVAIAIDDASRAFAVEEGRYQLECRDHDHSTDFIRLLGQVSIQDLDLSTVKFVISAGAVLSLVEDVVVGDRSISDGNSDSSPSAYIHYFLKRRAHTVPLSGFSALLFSALRAPRTLSEVVLQVGQQADFEGSTEQLERVVKLQIESAYMSGIIDAV